MRNMKESGATWLGLIPSHWTLGRIGQLYTERRIKVSDTEYQPLSVTMQGIVPQLSTAAKTDAHDDRKLVCKGDFAINSRSDRRGSCGISPYDGSVSLINTILAPRDEMNPNFYNWLFHTSEFASEFYKWGHGIVDDLWTTNWGDMKKISIPVPPISEQKQIADFLDHKCADIDNVIEKSRASIEEYKKLKQSIITSAVTKGLRDNRPMKISGIKWIDLIPEDWIESKIKYETQYNIESLTEQTDNDFEFDYIDIGSVEYGIGITHTERCKFGSAPSRARRVVHNGDVIVSTVRTYLKAMAKINAISFPTIVSTGFAVLTCMKGLLADFLYYYVQSLPFIEFVITHSTGIGYPSINCSDLVSASILKPSIEEQAEIASYLDQKCSEIDSLIASKEKFITELEIYKKSLIHEYVTGKKEVPTTV